MFGSISAQDFHLSQYEASPMYYNPALTGMFEGDYRMSGHFRNQWSSIATKPFTTTALSFDMPYKKFKVGSFLLNQRAGAGNYNVLNWVLSAAYNYEINSNPHHNLSGGLQLGVIHKSVNMNNLFFDQQYTPSNGGSFNTSLPNGEIFTNQSIILPESNIGILYNYSNIRTRFNPFIGVSVFHLTEPNESFYGVTNKLPRRYLVHGGSKFNIHPKVQLAAHGFWMKQVNVQEVFYTLQGYYYIKDADTYLMAGASFRGQNLYVPMVLKDYRDAAIIHFGLKYNDFTYRFSYDVNTSALSTISQGRGGFEMSIVYTLTKIDPNPVIPCSRL